MVDLVIIKNFAVIFKYVLAVLFLLGEISGFSPMADLIRP